MKEISSLSPHTRGKEGGRKGQQAAISGKTKGDASSTHSD